jgi:hypothetical protein
MALELVPESDLDVAAWETRIRLESEVGSIGRAKQLVVRARAVAPEAVWAELDGALDTLAESADAAANLEGAVRRSRAYLTLERFSEAAAALDAFETSRGAHLALATAWFNAELAGGLCPHVPAGLGNAFVCRAAWQKSALWRDEMPSLERAFQSGAGQDRDALEVFLGLRFVVPMMFGLEPPEAQPNADPLAEFARFQQMAEGLATTSASDASSSLSDADRTHFRALARFLEVVISGIRQASANVGARPLEPEALLEFHREHPNEPFARASVVALAALRAQREPVLAWLSKLDATDPEDPIAELLVWSGVASRDASAVERGKALLAERIADSPGEASTRALLLIAEADACTDPRAFTTLSRVAEPLRGPDTAPDLRLQAILDYAAAIEARDGAVSALQRLDADGSSIRELPTGNAADLALVLQMQAQRLRGQTSNQGERRALADEFFEVIERLSAAGSPNLIWWARAQYEKLSEGCRGCKKLPPEGPAVPPLSKALLERGILPIGSIGLSVRYQARGRLIPSVLVDPRLLPLAVRESGEAGKGPSVDHKR